MTKIWAAINLAQDHKWSIPMAPLGDSLHTYLPYIYFPNYQINPIQYQLQIQMLTLYPQYPPGDQLSPCLWMWRSNPSHRPTWSLERGPSCCALPQETRIAAELETEPLQYLPTKMVTCISQHKLATIVIDFGMLQSKKKYGTVWNYLSINFMIRY